MGHPSVCCRWGKKKICVRWDSILHRGVSRNTDSPMILIALAMS
jgi:hypothetical protein